MPTITGELRKWRRHKTNGSSSPAGEDTQSTEAVTGYVYHSDIWDDGDEATFIGHLVDNAGFYALVIGRQVYRLPKDEEMK